MLIYTHFASHYVTYLLIFYFFRSCILKFCIFYELHSSRSLRTLTQDTKYSIAHQQKVTLIRLIIALPFDEFHNKGYKDDYAEKLDFNQSKRFPYITKH